MSTLILKSTSNNSLSTSVSLFPNAQGSKYCSWRCLEVNFNRISPIRWFHQVRRSRTCWIVFICGCSVECTILNITWSHKLRVDTVWLKDSWTMECIFGPQQQSAFHQGTWCCFEQVILVDIVGAGWRTWSARGLCLHSFGLCELRLAHCWVCIDGLWTFVTSITTHQRLCRSSLRLLNQLPHPQIRTNTTPLFGFHRTIFIFFLFGTRKMRQREMTGWNVVSSAHGVIDHVHWTFSSYDRSWQPLALTTFSFAVLQGEK